MFNLNYDITVFPRIQGEVPVLFHLRHILTITNNMNTHTIYIYIYRVGVKIRVRVKGVKRIPIVTRRDHYAIKEIFTGANMTMMELDK